jgi:hypothetical protein
LLDAKWLIEVLAESLDRSSDVWGIASQDRKVTESVALLSYQKTIDNFPRD